MQNTTPLPSLFERELDGFLKWTPETIIADEAHITSDDTRPPVAYDLHLHEDLVLKEIKHLPTLLTDLAQVADVHVASYKKAVPHAVLGTDFPTYHTRSRYRPDRVVAEASLVTIYENTTAQWCSLVASSLIFNQPFQKDIQLFKWTDTTPHSKAIADGFLNLHHANIKDPQITSSLSKASKAAINVLVDWQLEGLMIWEFKSLVAADLDKMKAIGELTGPFKWKRCGDGSGYTCGAGQHGTKEGTRVKTGRKTGPDAKATPWNLPPRPQSKPVLKRKFNQDFDTDDLPSTEDLSSGDQSGIKTSGIKTDQRPNHIIQQVCVEISVLFSC